MSYSEREYRYSRHREDGDSDEDKYKSTTVRRYKVGGSSGGSRVERVERSYEEVEDDRRSRYSGRDDGRDSHSHIGRRPGETLEIDRTVEKTYYPDRPRSAFDPPSQRTVVEKRTYERDESDLRDRDRDDRYRTADREFDFAREPERRDTRIVRETRETIERDRESVASPRDRDFDRRSRVGGDDHHHDDVRTEVKRVERRTGENGEEVEVRVDKRVERTDHHDDHHHHHDHGDDVERYRKETEYYSEPTPAPIVIRQRAPEPQQIILREAPQPPPVIYEDRPRDPGYVVVRDQPREVARTRDDDYYYRDRRREDDYAMERYDRDRDRRRRDDRRDDRYDDDDEDVYVKRTVIRRERSESSDHHKRHLAEGGLAGAGIAALLASRRNKDGELPEHRGRKVIAGAALGALGTEVIRRAKSAYDERYGDEDEDEDRRRARSKSRSRLTTGLAIGAAALAVAGGLKYMQSNKIEKEEASRGRSRRRYSDDGYSRSRSRSKKTNSTANMAKAAAATGAIAGLVQHYRSKSRGRSKSRLRTGAEIAGAALTGAAASKLWERHKEKKAREHDRDMDDRHSEYSHSRSRSRSYSRPRARSFNPRDPADRELGLVEYGTNPLPPSGYESADGRRHNRDRSASAGAEREPAQKRSRSRLREAAAGVLGAGAAAIGIKKYQDAKKEREKSRDRERDRDHDRDPPRDHSVGSRDSEERRERRRQRRSRERERRRYEEEAGNDPYYSDGYDPHGNVPPSPPTASGGAFYPPPPGPPPGHDGFTQHPNQASTNLNNPYPPQGYPPQDFNPYPGPPGPPPPAGPPPPGPPGPHGPGYPGGHPNAPENVSSESIPGPSHEVLRGRDPQPDSGASAQDGVRNSQRRRGGMRPRSRSSSLSTVPDLTSQSPGKSVTFIPLSPQSSRTLRIHHQTAEEKERSRDRSKNLDRDDEEDVPRRPILRRHRSDSDPSFDRPGAQRRSRRRGRPPLSDDEDDVEVLPDRFDPSGHPLDSRDPRGWTSQHGDFEFRPKDRDGPHVSGAWGVGGTNPEMVNQVAQSVGSLLQGRQGLLGVLGGVLANGLPGLGGAGAGGGNRARIEDDRDRRRRGEEESDDDGAPRRRRNRRRRDDDSD